MLRLALVAVFFLMYSGFAAQSAAQQEELAYRLGTGDELNISVFGHEDLSREVKIDGSGAISLPLIGTVEAEGLTVRELERRIVDRLRPDYLKNPQVSVQVLNFRPFYIIGEVKNPGSYPYVEGMTVVNAVALAGGYTYRADEDDVLLTRGNVPGREPIEANQSTPVLPGDLIEVPERFF